MPVSSEISAFHASTSSRRRTCTVQPPSGVRHHLLLGQLQLDRPAAHRQLAGAAGPARAAPRCAGCSRPASRSACTPGVVQPGPGAHHAPGARRPRPARPPASRSIVHSTAARGPSGQQAGRVLGQHRRVQRHRAVGQVDGLPAAAHLGVQRPAGLRPPRRGRRWRSAPGSRRPRRATPTAWSRSFEPGGSMVTSSTSVASTRSGPRSGPARRRPVGLGEHLRREARGQRELGAHGGEVGLDVAADAGRDARHPGPSFARPIRSHSHPAPRRAATVA